MSIPSIGERAPDFTAYDAKGELLSVGAAGSPLVLLFLRYLGCSLCRGALASLAERHLELASRGAQLWVFVPSPETSVQNFFKKNHPPFHLVSDPSRRLYELYGVEEDKFLLSTARGLSARALLRTASHVAKFGHGLPEGSERQRAGAFVVDADGLLRYQYLAETILDEPPLDELLLVLDALPPWRRGGIS